MKYIILLILLFAVVSCSDSGNNIFKDKDENLRYEVQHIFFDTFEEVDKEYIRIYSLDNSEDKIEFEKGTRYGFTYFMNGICYVVMAKPDKYKSLSSLERTLGHEHLHCLYGSWHR